MTRLFLARKTRMKRYRQVDDTIISLTKGTNQNRVFRLRKSCIFVPFVRRNNRIFRLWKSCIFVPFVRRQVDGTIISRTKVAKLFIYARMARMERYLQVDGTIISCTKDTNETISTSRWHDYLTHEWHEWDDIDKSMTRFFFARNTRMKRYRQVDDTIISCTNGTNDA